MTEPVPEPQTEQLGRAAISFPDVALAGAVTLLGILLFLATLQIPFGINAVVGPRVFPLIVSVGMTMVGTFLLVAALRGDRAEPATEEDTDPNAPVNHMATNVILGGFLVGAALLPSLGFVVGTAIMFSSVAFAFGERRWPLVIGVALLVALTAYVTFTRGLGLTLPPGILKGLL